MWKWIKSIFTPKRQHPDIKSVKPNTVIISKKPIDFTGLTKGDIKNLKGQGKI
jgi:hypothetical protein